RMTNGTHFLVIGFHQVFGGHGFGMTMPMQVLKTGFQMVPGGHGCGMMTGGTQILPNGSQKKPGGQIGSAGGKKSSSCGVSIWIIPGSGYSGGNTSATCGAAMPCGTISTSPTWPVAWTSLYLSS